MTEPSDPTRSAALERFKAALKAAYGARIARIVLYGSRARGDARPDSDYDVAVFFKELPDYWAESNRLADLSTDILYDCGILIHAMPHGPGAEEKQTPLMYEIHREGIEF